MRMNLEKANKFIYGLIPGLLLPLLFMWFYLNRFYPQEIGFVEIIKEFFPGVLMGKVLLLSVIPNLLLVYLFYTLDSSKLAVGMITGAMIYLIPSFFML